MEFSVFTYHRYRDILRIKLAHRSRRGQLSKAAQFLGCQASLLSRILNEELHLTPDLAFKLTLFFSFGPDEREYFMKLVDFERSGSADYRALLRKQLDEIIQRNSEIGVRTRRSEKLFDGLAPKYFSSWTYSAVHFLVCIPEYQTFDQIQLRLGLKPELLREVLDDLEGMSFIKFEKGKWVYQSGEFHLARTSPFVLFHHQNWRQQALLNAQKSASDNQHYTTILTLSKKDCEKIKDLILNLLAEVNSIAAPSDPEEVLNLNLDFYRI